MQFAFRWAKRPLSNNCVKGLETFAITGEVLIALDDQDLEIDIGVTSFNRTQKKF